jgi:osmotically-inducible protein OsmY
MSPLRITLAAAMSAAVALTALPGCSVMRHQQSASEYVDDATITAKVKSKFAEDKTVSAMAIKVDTFDGLVTLSGAAKSGEEKSKAESLARSVAGVKGVKNAIIVRT